MAKLSRNAVFAALILAAVVFVGQTSAGFFSDIFGSPRSVSCTSSTTANGPDYMEWVSLSFIALVFGAMFVSVGYVLSGAFSSAQYNEFLKGKLWEIVETAALLSIFTLSFAGLNDYGSQNIRKAQAYSMLIQNTIMFDFGIMLATSMATGFIVNINPQFKLPGPAFISLGFQITPMFKPIIDALNLMMQLITTAVGMWSAQGMLLCFVKSQMLVLFLPVGFFLRAVGVKGGGNALIGIALALYFVYPYLIIMAGEIVTNHMATLAEQSGTPHIWGTCSDQPICCASPAGVVPAPDDPDYLPNGKNWATDPAYRIKIDTVLNSGFAMVFTSSSTGPQMCMFNNMLSRLYRATVVDIVQQLTTWGAVGTIAGGVALKYLFQSLNISWLAVFLMVPLSFFVLHSVEEMLYFVFIVTIIMPLFILFITLTLAREISRTLGTEIDLSSLEKLI